MKSEIRINETEAGATFNIYDGNNRLVARSPIFKDGAVAKAGAAAIVAALRGPVTIVGGPSFEAAKATLVFDQKGRPNSVARGEV